MKKQIIATLIAGLMGSSVALAIPSTGTITVTGSPSEYSNGGQFTATVGSETFQTYCIELYYEFSLGGTYNYTLGQTTHGAPPATASLVLNLGTAWLYSQFASGALFGTLTPTTTQAGELQAALWYFQGQGANPNGAYSGLGFGDGLPGANAYTDAAIAALGGLANATSASGGAYGVQVIESSTIDPNGGPGTPAQDWLYVSVPDGGATVMLLGFGLVSMALASRRYAVAR